MSACGMSCFPSKHATLVNNCYPTTPGETNPKSNELSYLQFYAESRPEKLTKVGVYLERKVEADIWKKKAELVKVSMAIWRAVISSSATQVNFYADPLLKSIKAVLDSEDLSVFPDATETFTRFCEVNGKLTLLPDSEIFELYLNVIKSYRSFALSEDTNSNIQSNLRKCGIEALVAVANSEILHNSDSKSLVKILVPALIFNISQPVENHEDTSPTYKRMSSNKQTEEEITPTMLNSLASHGFADLARLSSVIHLRFMIDCVFEYIEEKNLWAKSDFIKELILLVSSSAQPQFRYIPVAVVLKLLESEENMASYVKMHCLINTLEALLNKRQSLVGISVLEILNTLVLRLITLPTSTASSSDPTKDPSVLASQTRIIQTIGKLGSQVYYSDQIMDVLSYLVNKLRIGGTETSMGSIPITEGRVLILQAMTRVLKEHHQEITKRPGESKATISLNVFTSTISLLLNSSPFVRLEFFYFIYELIQGLNHHERVSKSHERDFLFSLHRALFDYASNPNNLPMDYMILHHILASLYPALGEFALIRTIPLIFRLQALEADDQDSDLSHHLALSGVVVHFFDFLSNELPSDDLSKYVEEIKSKRKSISQWLVNFDLVQPEALHSMINISFKDIKGSGIISVHNIVDVFFDPEVITEILLGHPHIQVSPEEAKRQMLEEYNPEKSNYDFQESKFRIRPSRSVRSQRNNMDSGINSVEPARIVRIENLRDALAVPNQDSSEFDSDSEIISPSISTSKKSPHERNSRVDVNSLLQSINVSNSLGRKSAVSLVSGPFQNA